VNKEIAQRIIDSKPTEAAHLYIDENNIPRDQHIENLFRDLFEGLPLTDVFRCNFEVFYQELIADRSATVPAHIFVDAATAQRWIGKHIGTVSVRPLNPAEIAINSDDPELARLRYSATIRTAPKRSIRPAQAPSELHATLLAAVFVFRHEADKRLRKFFAPALKRG
jgi:hypothetical protein